MLSERQELILRVAVEAHLDSGRPVGSRAIAELPAIRWGPSTIRSELASLEQRGLLTHPHTSAGRIPTGAGYRVYTDALLEHSDALPARRAELDLTRARLQVDAALRETTEALSRVTDLVAVATAPPASSAVVRRVEVIALKPSVVMVIVIASDGSVAKRALTFSEPVDDGLVEWAESLLNERIVGIEVGSRRIADLLRDDSLSEREAEFMAALAPALATAGEAGADELYVDGTAHLIAGEHAGEIEHAGELLQALESRASVLQMLRSMLDERSIFCWIGAENPAPELREVSVVGANYGLGYRNLGSIGLVGPLRMDYATAIATVREAAGELSRFFAGVYEG